MFLSSVSLSNSSHVVVHNKAKTDLISAEEKNNNNFVRQCALDFTVKHGRLRASPYGS